jgi:hypothetical protein
MIKRLPERLRPCSLALLLTILTVSLILVINSRLLMTAGFRNIAIGLLIPEMRSDWLRSETRRSPRPRRP